MLTTRLRFEPWLFAFLFTLLLFSIGYAVPRTVSTTRDDRLTISPRKVVLVRTGEHAREFPERSKATVIYPVVEGPKNSPLLGRVRAILAIKNVFGSSLDEYRDDGWLTDFGYKIDYNRNYFFDITFTESGIGAYPDEHTKHFLINLRNGKLIKRSDVFVDAKLGALASLVDAQLQKELRDIARENTGSTSEYMESLASQGDFKFAAKNLDDFSVGPRGITFLYDAGFPHMIKAFQPTGAYFFSYSRLKPYIKREGPLGQFID